MSKVNATFFAVDCETYFSEGGCGANLVLNIQSGGRTSDIVNALSDYKTGELRCCIFLLQNSRLRPERNEKLASRSSNWKSRNDVTERMASRQTQLLFNITLQPISFLYFYHLTDINKLRYQASESKMASETTCTGRTFDPTSTISFLCDLRQKFFWR